MTNLSLVSAVAIESSLAQVCLIEDDIAFCQLIIDVLDSANISVQACPLGWNAQRCIRTKLPKVVILDIQIPEVDGIQLFYTLRGDPKTASIPVLFLTGNPRKVRCELPNYEAMNAVLLCKPFHAEELVELVRMLVAR